MTMIILIASLVLFIFLGVIAIVSYMRDIEDTNKKIALAEKRHYTLIKIAVPKQNTKSPFAAEQMFSALHGIYRKSEVDQEHFSFEIAATSTSINFYMLLPTHLRDFIEGQVYSQYPTVEIESVSDYSNVSLEDKAIAGAEIKLTKADVFPIRTFANFDVDPLAGITGVLSKINEGEVMSIQAVLSPISDAWQKDGLDYVKKIKEGKSVAPPPPLHKELQKQGATFLKEIGTGVIKGVAGTAAEAKKEEKKEVKLSGPEEAGLKGIEAKVVKLGYAMTIRVLSIANNEILAQTRVESVLGAFKQFNLTNLNGFDLGEITTDASFLRTFRTRSLGSKPFRMNVEEIASVFHLPDASVETPNIAWAGSKKGEPPQNLPIDGEVPAAELTTFGMTSFRNRKIKFGIKQIDRLLHFYIIGKTGTGKSTLIENMIYDDIKEGRGVAVVDPHGELIDHILDFIPEERVKDVVYFNPADTDHPLAFNLLEDIENADMRGIIASGLMSIFTKLWAGVWSARMEYILRNSILAVLEVPNATLLSIMRVLNDPVYRKYVMSHVTDPVVRDFFINEYDKYDAKFRQEAIAPIQNKVGQFLSSSTIRNIVGQPKSTFNLLEVMDSGKIFLVNLSIGRIGEDSSKLLGSMLITKLQLAAMSRAKKLATERREFFLYVDEFQNFATDSFATILSEARKYKLGLILANQYIAQIPELVADAIFGNVGSMVSFRVGPTDADKLVKEFVPVFDANDLINLPNRNIYTKMAIDGVTSRPFSAHTLPPRGLATDNKEKIIELSRQTYSRRRDDVEREINDLAQADYRPESEKEYDDFRQYPYILGSTLYKEFSAKGGQRWYFGQPPEFAIEELDAAGVPIPEEMRAAAQLVGKEPKKESDTPPTAPASVEAETPKTITPVEKVSAHDVVPYKEPEILPAVMNDPEPQMSVVQPDSPVSVVPQESPHPTSENSEIKKKRKRKRKKKNNGNGGEGQALVSSHEHVPSMPSSDPAQEISYEDPDHGMATSLPESEYAAVSEPEVYESYEEQSPIEYPAEVIAEEVYHYPQESYAPIPQDESMAASTPYQQVEPSGAGEWPTEEGGVTLLTEGTEYRDVPESEPSAVQRPQESGWMPLDEL
ncbi:MAG TPA: type IV secretion system DNA-binding domain-containing protein [Patescibacteria group bacterium]